MQTRLTLFIIFIFSSLFSGAEGTKQLTNDSTALPNLFIQTGNSSGGAYSCFGIASCDDAQSLFIHISHPGEKIYLGFWDLFQSSVTFTIKHNGVPVYSNTAIFAPGSPGYIQYYAQAVAGPDALNIHGYPAITFSPTELGDYRINFTLPSSNEIFLRLWDITVVDETQTPLVPIPGRIWSKQWCFSVPGPMKSTMYCLTTDSIITSVNFNRMVPMQFDMTCSSNGCFPPPALWDTSNRSRSWNHHYAEYKLFLNDPDSIEYPTGTFGEILGDTVNVTRGCNGTFTFRFRVGKPGKVMLNIETNLLPGIQPEDLTITRSVQTGFVNIITWNGMNGLGVPVPCGDSVAITIKYVNGLTNLALYDVESNGRGFIIELVRPPGPPLATYWNDTLLVNNGGRSQLDGCYANPPDSGCHTWTQALGLGALKTINTWYYAASSLLDLGRFSVACVPHTPQEINGPTTLCNSETTTYTCIPNPHRES